MNHLHTTAWAVLPYLVATLAITGTAWRYHYDRFGFTTRSSQLHESRLLRIGGPLFHYGLLFVVAGHVVGLLVPESWTEKLRVGERLYHANALLLGGVAGIACVVGLAVLMWRRLRVTAVRNSTSGTDRVVYPLLTVVLLAGLTATATGVGSDTYDYRTGVSVWFRSLFVLDPDVAAMRHAPFVYQLHALLAMALFGLWPFSRLVHAFTAPLGYLVRPYVVYRSVPAGRSRSAARSGARRRAGREPVRPPRR
ncbi:respiratory nitrate reductase subunit gamma, partial [Streptomyces sp. SID3343]|uniref:respiratory nitrate reductase subunit gamma n=1 Tax=Streptomyces sp. SID3343 TaxID=2690260 RepID=UPI001371C2CD